MIEANEPTRRYGPATAVDDLTFTPCPGPVPGFPESIAPGDR